MISPSSSMLYELINPSDAYTMRADDFKVAAIACIFLGRGRYALDARNDAARESGDMPIFISGGCDEWFTERFGQHLNDAASDILTNQRDALVTCLRSLIIGNVADRIDYEAAMAAITDHDARERLTRDRHERRRTSMNDIGKRASDIADAIVADANAKATAAT